MTKEIRRIQEFSGTLYVGIPATNKRVMGVSKGDYVNIECLNGKMIVEPVNSPAKNNSQASHSPPIKEGAANE